MSATRLIDGYEQLARAVLDSDSYAYFAGGSGTELSLDEAAVAWSRYRLRPHVLRDVSAVDRRVELLGDRLASPLGVAPVAYQRLLNEAGEVATARGAGSHLFVLSTRSTRTIEDVAAATGGPWWFQVYVTADATLSTALAERAATAGARALVLTGDTPYVGVRARAAQLTALRSEDLLVNFGPHLRAGSDPDRDIEQSPAVTTDDIARLADATGLPVVVKGVLRADDAVRCLDAGAAGVYVSNHGGRQLDRAIATAFALPEVVAAAGSAPVLVDGGLRSGLDVLVALALGARAALLARPVAWAVAAGGSGAVNELFGQLDTELDQALALAGAASCAQLSADLVVGD